jgi:transcriptional regulator with XRE-family HTH domain
MPTTLKNTKNEAMAATMKRARMLLHMKQGELAETLGFRPQMFTSIETGRAYPSRVVVERFAERYEVNLDVYDWARGPANADALPGLLGLVPAHIVRLYERRLIDTAVREGRTRRLPRKSSFADLPSIV